MERLTESKFGKFEGMQVANLSNVCGGQATGGGTYGNFFNGYIAWDSDTFENGKLTANDPYFLSQEQYVGYKSGALC